jgi:hypothetical protein
MLKLNRPVEVSGQRASALRLTDLRVLALWHLLVLFRLLPCGFANGDLRAQLAVLTGQQPHQITQGKMTYDRRRLRLHGMIERIPKTHRYRVTDFGFRAALFFTRTHAGSGQPSHGSLDGDSLGTCCVEAPHGDRFVIALMPTADRGVDPNPIIKPFTLLPNVRGIKRIYTRMHAFEGIGEFPDSTEVESATTGFEWWVDQNQGQWP